MQKVYDELNGTLVISDSFDINSGTYSINSTPIFNNIDDEYILSFINLKNVKELKGFWYDTNGLTSTRYLNTTYRVSMDNISWSVWLPLNNDVNNFPIVDTSLDLFIDIKWVRGGSSTIGLVRILEYEIEALIERDVIDDGSFIQLNSTASLILKAPYIYKVFKITDTEVISGSDLTDVSIKYRFSQDHGRSWSPWEFLTRENISSVRINPIRFFQIEYNITNNSNIRVYIQDINLIGDFQNVSKDYFKTNLFGIRECCQSLQVGYIDDGGLTHNSCSSGDNILPNMTSEEKSGLYNPYEQTSALSLLNKLSTDSQQIFGHKVTYFATDVDKNGQDHSLNEYQLYNVSCQGSIKVSVDGNNFPDSQITMNQFDLNLFQTMEVHITKQQFKEVFGPQRRPAKEDFLYFCDVNRMYTVDHAQQFRGFNNTAVYYKLILKKYNERSNVDFNTIDLKNSVDQLTQNSTIDELFGVEVSRDKSSVANKQQHRTLSKDPIRLEYLVNINKELIENSSTIISKSHYDLSLVNKRTIFGIPAVKYKNLDPILNVSDNISFTIWFNINNYILDDIYNLFSYYDEVNNLGWMANIVNDTIHVTTNETTYDFDLTGLPTNDVVSLEEDVWYCYVVNIDQRQRTLEQFVYKRDVDMESLAATLPTTLLRKLFYNKQDYEPIEYLIEDVDKCMILSSDMKVTNIRLFSDVIPESYHNKLLNQYIIGNDSRYLVFADNATSRIYLPNFPYNE